MTIICRTSRSLMLLIYKVTCYLLYIARAYMRTCLKLLCVKIMSMHELIRLAFSPLSLLSFG